MRVHLLLSWYDEDPNWLAATITSASKLCTSVIALDGAYALFPGALRQPHSSPDEVDAIARTADALGMACTIHVPAMPWFGNEVAKRDTHFRLGETIATVGEDWYLLLDADEVLSDCPPDAFDRLAASDWNVAECFLWEKDVTSIAPALGAHPIRRLYRVLPGLHCGPAHHCFTAIAEGKPVWISDASRSHNLEPAGEMWDVRIEHRNRFRAEGRLKRKKDYYATRDSLGVESIDR